MPIGLKKHIQAKTKKGFMLFHETARTSEIAAAMDASMLVSGLWVWLELACQAVSLRRNKLWILDLLGCVAHGSQAADGGDLVGDAHRVVWWHREGSEYREGSVGRLPPIH